MVLYSSTDLPAVNAASDPFARIPKFFFPQAPPPSALGNAPCSVLAPLCVAAAPGITRTAAGLMSYSTEESQILGPTKPRGSTRYLLNRQISLAWLAVASDWVTAKLRRCTARLPTAATICSSGIAKALSIVLEDVTTVDPRKEVLLLWCPKNWCPAPWSAGLG
jgi:hypothetical protein